MADKLKSEMTPGKKGRFLVKPNLEPTKEISDGLGKESSDSDLAGKGGGAAKDFYSYSGYQGEEQRDVTFLDSLKVHLDSFVTYPSERSEKKAAKMSSKAKLGMLLGVYLPTIQHIMGLLMFIRHSWILGHSGLIETLIMVALCCLTTFFTVISVSAIATNGKLRAGGSYYVLSRNLGPECGGSIGICFYLANTFATCLYLLGSIELFLVYMVPSWAVFGNIHTNPWNNFRIYGTCLLVIVTVLVAMGVKFVQLFAPVSLVCVIISILSIVVGSFMANPTNKPDRVCMLGERLFVHPKLAPHSSSHYNMSDDWCSKNETSFLYHMLCNKTSSVCEPDFINNEVNFVPAIPGLASGVIKDNLFSHYMDKGDVASGLKGNSTRGEVVSDTTTNFIVLCAIYFPSVTGILTGVNMSGDLKNPQRSIPKGTILAQLTCSFVYLLLVVLYGATIRGEVLRDKFGASLGGELVSALLCWPNKWVVLVGAFSSSLGAGLQCLVSAPRLLQAIARDDIIPFLSIFKKLTRHGEPLRALVLTFFIAEIGMLIADIDLVAPIIDVFFLMCYLFVNLICVIQTMLKLPHWRPRFRFYHWTLSLAGVLLNFTLCIIAGWVYALSAFAIALFILLYIQYKGGEKEWGDGLTGLVMSFTEQALISHRNQSHVNNWRPQILILDSVEPESDKYNNPHLLALVSQLKRSRGLTLMGTVIVGNPLDNIETMQRISELFEREMKSNNIKGFAKVITCSNLGEGLSVLVQCLGLGSMTHNTVLVPWPATEDKSTFISLVKLVRANNLALLLLKAPDFPGKGDRLTGTIDIWWIIHDGGMLILLSFLLQQHKVWKNCKIRIFTVAHMGDNCAHIKSVLESYLYEIRISAQVFVEEMFINDISAYEAERTLDMEARVGLMKKVADKKLSNYWQILKVSDSAKLSEKSIHKHKEVIYKTKDEPLNVLPKKKDAESVSSETKKPDGAINRMLNLPVHFTFSAKDAKKLIEQKPNKDTSPVLQMHDAVELNKVLRAKSSEAELVIINLPAPPTKPDAVDSYVDYLVALTQDLHRTLFVRGSGKEMVSAYS